MVMYLRTASLLIIVAGVNGFILGTAPTFGQKRLSHQAIGTAQPLHATPKGELQEVEVEFYEDGRVSMKVNGVKGPACKEITDFLMEGLAEEVLVAENTAEYVENSVYENVQDQVQVREGTGGKDGGSNSATSGWMPTKGTW